MRSLLLPFFQIFIGLLCPSLRASDMDCLNFAGNLSREERVFQSFDFSAGTVYQPPDLGAIERIWLSTAEPVAKIDQIFDVYKKARFRDLSLGARKFVEDALRKGTLPRELDELEKIIKAALESKGATFQLDDNGYNWDHREVRFKQYPAELGMQVLRAVVRAHEMEHAIQHALANELGNADLARLGMRATHADYERNLFRVEASAMAAESDFIRSIPGAENVIAEAIEGLARKHNITANEYADNFLAGKIQDPSLDTHMLLLIYWGLKHSKTAREYVAFQVNDGKNNPIPRYDLDQIRKIREMKLKVDLARDELDRKRAEADAKVADLTGKIRKMRNKAILAVGTLTLGLAGYAWGCSWLRENHPKVADRYCIGPFGKSDKSAAALEKALPQ